MSETLLSLLPDGIKITELKKAHFQSYIDLRRTQTAKVSKKPVLDETIDKELYSISSALAAAPLYFPELDEYQKPQIPKAKPKGQKERRRDRLVDKSGELDRVLAELRKPRTGKQTYFHEAQRRRLADDLEFRFETGLRRKEVARLKKKQYFPKEQSLRKVNRWKTGTITKFFPLSRRAVAIIESRLALSTDSEYIFTDDGEPNESDYRALKTVCQKLNIPYGRFTDGGFIPHDLRHNFASEVIRHTDIKTAQEFLGHSNIQQTNDYLHTTETQMREAIQRRDGIDLTSAVIEIYKDVKRGKIKARKFVERVKFLVS